MEKIVESDPSCPDGKGQPASRTPFRQVMEALSANAVAQAHELCQQHSFRPKLGQLLIASGRLSPADLDSMLVVHEHEEIKTVPMGKLLVLAGLLTEDELNQYFELQKLLRFPSRQQDAWGEVLVAQNLLTQDQLNTALNDQIVTNVTLREALTLRGWITPQMLEHLDTQIAPRGSDASAQTCKQTEAVAPS